MMSNQVEPVVTTTGGKVEGYEKMVSIYSKVFPTQRRQLARGDGYHRSQSNHGKAYVRQNSIVPLPLNARTLLVHLRFQRKL